MARKKKKKRGGAAEDGDATEVPAAVKAPKSISRPFADALKGMKAAPAGSGRRSSQGSQGSQGSKGSNTTGTTEAPRGKKQGGPPLPASPPEQEGTGSTPAPAAAPYSRQDRAAFHNAFANVAPLGAKQRAQAERAGSQEPRRVARAPRVDFDAVARAKLSSLVSDGLSFEVRREQGWVEGQRTDAPKSALRDLRDGRASADAELDLHGMTGDQAARALVRSLRQARGAGRQIVRVIHGKGLHSAGGVGVLGDRVVATIIDGPAGPLVYAFVTAALASGGSGALLVRLGNR